MVTNSENYIVNCLDYGLRFTGITIPQGTSIASAFIDLTIDRSQGFFTTTTIVGQDTDDAAPIAAPTFCCTFSATNSFDITSRVSTTASVNWPTGGGSIPVLSLIHI